MEKFIDTIISSFLVGIVMIVIGILVRIFLPEVGVNYIQSGVGSGFVAAGLVMILSSFFIAIYIKDGNDL